MSVHDWVADVWPVLCNSSSLRPAARECCPAAGLDPPGLGPVDGALCNEYDLAEEDVEAPPTRKEGCCCLVRPNQGEPFSCLVKSPRFGMRDRIDWVKRNT
eukprot:34738-Chlamydomonas_euryale.AAC.2